MMLGDKKRLVQSLTWASHSAGVHDFVETGTGEGDTAFWAAELFDRVITIEEDSGTSRRFTSRMRRYPCQGERIILLRGSSPSTLIHEALPQLNLSPTVFWLDAHRHEFPTGSPVLAELKAIHQWGGPAIVLVDDYTLFSLQPKDKKAQRGWPYFTEILAAFRSWIIPYRMIDDVIVGVTPSLCSMSDFLYGAFPNRLGLTKYD